MANVIHELGEIYQSRNIMKALIIKNLVGKYKNTFFGFIWHFFTPTVLLLVYYIVFTEIRETVIPNFWIYMSCGLFPFNYIVSNLTGGCACITSNASMIKKMYFPREILVLSQVLSSFFVMIIGYLVVMICIIISGYNLNISVLFLPVVMILLASFVLGIVFIISSLTVYVRDIQYFLSSISIVFYFMTPMYFTTDYISGVLEKIVWLNPLTYYVEAFHKIVYYGTVPETNIMIPVVCMSIFAPLLGLCIFRKLRRGFAERL